MIISTKLKPEFDREYKNNLEKLHHMDEDEVVELLMQFATLGVPADKQTEEFKNDVEESIRGYLKKKPKTKLDLIKEAIQTAKHCQYDRDGDVMIPKDDLDLLVECAEAVVVSYEGEKF